MSKIRVVLVGVGGMGRVWASIISSDKRFDLVGISDVNKVALNDLVGQINFSGEVNMDLKNLLKNLEPDLVIDVTPPFARKNVVEMSLKSNCNVMCEKPFGDSMEVAKSLSRLAAKNNKMLMVSQNYRWSPAVEMITEALRIGDMGRLLKVSALFGIKTDFNGFRLEMNHPLLLDMAVHHFDLVRKFINVNAESVYCAEYQLGESKFIGPASASAIFEMKNNVIFRYEGSLTIDNSPENWNGEWNFICENGSIKWDGFSNLEATVDGVRKKLPISSLGRDKLEVSLDKAYDALVNGIEPETGYEDNLETSKMVFGAIRSSEKHSKVFLDEI